MQSIYNHMVGRAASVVSPFYFILLALPTFLCKRQGCIMYMFLNNHFIPPPLKENNLIP